MKENIRFLVLWVGTKCSLRCKDCCNLIPYVQQESYNVNEIIDNLNYVTKDVKINLLKIQGGEPFTHKNIDEIIQKCANNNNIDKIEIATNGTIMPNKKTIEIIKKNNKVSIRVSNYKCAENSRIKIEKALKKEGIDIEEYDFVYSTGEWYYLGSVDNEREKNLNEIKAIYSKCPNRSCWTLAKNYFATCGRMINLLTLKSKETIKNNNIIDINELIESNIDFIDVYQEFEKRYNDNNNPSILCGYCQKDFNKIPAAIQLLK